MLKSHFVLIVLMLVCALSFALFGQEVEPNDATANATPLTLNVLLDAKLSVADTVDFFRIDVNNTSMYLIGTVTNFTFNAEKVLNMDVVGADGKSVLNSDPSTRYKNFGARLTGWIPPATGTYYVKIWSTTAKLAAVADASYQMRFWYGTPKETAMTREPDNTPAQADVFGEIPTDGTRIYGYLYNVYTEGDTFRTNWNDIDLYKFTVPEAGMQIIAETFTPALQWNQPSWCRDTDTKIYLFDATGAVTPINNDDKDPWAGDMWDDKTGWFSNSFSRFVSPAVPAAGTYYLGVVSVYNTVAGLDTRKPHESDKNPGGGEYYVSVKVIGANDPSLVAQDLPLNTLKAGSISAADTLDVWGIYAEADKMYTIATVTDMNKFNAKAVIKMSVVDENNKNVLNSDPSSRNDAYGAILRGWVPPKTGVYYVKVWGAPDKLAAIADPSYQMRFWHGTPLSVASTVHEPDNVVADAVKLPAVPVDGTMIHGYLYNDYVEADTFRTNWNDMDLYKIEVPEAGMILTAETFTVTRLEGHPEWIREVDTEIELLDATGAVTPINNDDKSAWAGDADYGILSNTFSRFITPEIPAAGTYYVRVISYYNSVTRNEKPHMSHRNAGGGEYLVSFRLISANDPSLIAQTLPLNELKAGSISAADTLDVWGIYAEADKMYTIATVTDMNKFNAKAVIKMSVVDENNKNVLNSDPSSRNDAYGAILRGWVPPKTGVYYVKVWGAPDKLAAIADPSYQMRFWHGTPLSVASTVHEPDNVVADAVKLPAVPVDGTMIHGYLYNDYVEADTFRTNWNDMDLYKIEVPEAGMILTAETFTVTRLEGHPEWIREVDTEIELLDATGAVTPINNDDKSAWAGDADYGILSNTFSRFITPEIPAAGTYYVRVISYYNSVTRNEKPHMSHRNAGGGEYLVSFTLTWPKENEPNNDMAGANLITLQTILDAALSPTDSVDYFKFRADADKMYTLNTIAPRGVNAKSVIKMSVFDETGANVLNADPSSRYDSWGARLTGWVPPSSGLYFVKIKADVSTFTAEYPYKIRLWYGTPLATAKTTHEPDDTVADAAKLPALDLANPTKIHGYLYNDFVDSLGKHYNWNDFDLYKVVLKAGDILTAELFTAGPDSCIRDLDTELVLLDSLGNATPIENDDKDAWEGDNWENLYPTVFSNTFSRFITPEIPVSGTYYIQVNSYYNSRNRTEKWSTTDRNPGGGEYMLLAGVNMGVGVERADQIKPLTFELAQNYPNPFNPTTTIRYSLPQAETVQLTIYNMLGQKVKDLVNVKQQAGNYSIVWDATDRNGITVPTGVYFYRIEAGSFVKVHKMILLK
ncbi:MAG TPA: T9SS type A sorting domain-containing protein [bacterium]|nr:T9SS type A sorting domain-containing protein [bacterium]